MCRITRVGMVNIIHVLTFLQGRKGAISPLNKVRMDTGGGLNPW